MIRLLYALSVLALLAAGGLLVLCARQRPRGDLPGESLLERPGAMANTAQQPRGTSLEEQEHVSPLMAAASAFAANLNPPAPVKAPAVVSEAPRPAPAAPVVRPPVSSPKVTVCGTSCCDDQPQRSMALILEPGSKEPARWVRRGAQVGHLVIQEIRPGAVVYLDGEQVHEMAMERETTATAVAAESRDAIEARPPVAATAEAARPPVSAKRPGRSKSMTVGSARTAALN